MSDQSDQQTEPTRRPYETPRIIDRGDVRDVTMGGSPGGGDSGQPLVQLPPG